MNAIQTDGGLVQENGDVAVTVDGLVSAVALPLLAEHFSLAQVGSALCQHWVWVALSQRTVSIDYFHLHH